MSALMRAELLRLISRRLVVVLLVCMAGLAAFGAALDADSARPVSGQDQRDALASLKYEKSSWEEECGDPQLTGAQGCDEWEYPSIESHLRQPISFGDYAEGVTTLGFPLVLLGVAVLAASMVGGEFSSGNIATQLLFTPRRIPLMFAKLVAATLGGFMLTVAYLGAAVGFCAIMFLSLRGAEDMVAGIDLPLALGRIVVLSLLVAVMSGALTIAVGSTLITAGVFAVVYVGSATLANSIPGHSLVQLFLPHHVLYAMALGETDIFGYVTDEWGDWGVLQTMHYDWALGYSVIGTALIVVVAAWWFRRRDILR